MIHDDVEELPHERNRHLREATEPVRQCPRCKTTWSGGETVCVTCGTELRFAPCVGSQAWMETV